MTESFTALPEGARKRAPTGLSKPTSKHTQDFVLIITHILS